MGILIKNGTLENGCQPPVGIDHVIVNGKITVLNGKHTGTLNGQILRHKTKNLLG